MTQNNATKTMKPEKLPIITIDGPAGVGKSTLANLLANKLNIPSLNTGAMFRYLALQLGSKGLDLSDEELLAKENEFSFSLKKNGDASELYCNGKIIGNEIKNENVGALASAYGNKKGARQILLNAQRKLAEKTPLVTEGRDMGTVVFPDAACKFFLEATPKARAMRRWLEYAKSDNQDSLEEIERQIIKRDQQDRGRSIAPLKPAEDAVIIDTSDLTIPQVLGKMLAAINSANLVNGLKAS